MVGNNLRPLCTTLLVRCSLLRLQLQCPGSWYGWFLCKCIDSVCFHTSLKIFVFVSGLRGIWVDTFLPVDHDPRGSILRLVLQGSLCPYLILDMRYQIWRGTEGVEFLAFPNPYSVKPSGGFIMRRTHSLDCKEGETQYCLLEKLPTNLVEFTHRNVLDESDSVVSKNVIML